MNENDDLPRNLPPKPKDLEIMSIEGLEDYVAEMEAEIVRARAMIEAKSTHLGNADLLFKK